MNEEFQVPDLIGPYRLEELLGKGGMGRVYAAHDERLGRRVAIKHLRPESMQEPMAQERIRREARTVANLDHPSVVQVFDVIEDDSGSWIVMEHVDGPTLAQLLEAGPLEVARVLRFGHQIAEGLAGAHAKGVVHRDLKSENVMLAPSGYTKILDFGLAKQIDPDMAEESLSASGAILGTVRAMSPEQARGFPVDPRSDLFSLGTLLYELLTGVSPFRGITGLDTMTRVATHRQPPVRELRPDVPEGLSELIDHLLEKDPAARPKSAERVAMTLEALRLGIASNAFEAVGAEQETLYDDSSETLLRAPAGQAEATPDSRPAQGTADPPQARSRQKSLPWIALMVLLAGLIFALTQLSDRAFEPKDSLAAVGSDPQAKRDTGGEAGTEDGPSRLRRGWRLLESYHQEQNIDRAIELFQGALAEDDGSAEAHAGLSRAYWRSYWNQGKDPVRLEQAVAVARRAVELEPLLASAHASLGFALQASGQGEEALASFDQALVHEPTRVDALLGRGDAMAGRGDLDGALETYQRALEIRPDHAEVLDALGITYYQKADYEAAREAFERSLESRPDRPYAYRNLAAVHHMQGDLAAASRRLQEVLTLRPTATNYANLGTLLFAQGLYTQAADAYRRALDHGGANDATIWANLGDAYRWSPGSEAQARQAFTRAVQMWDESLAQATDPDTDLTSRKALALCKTGTIDPALELLESLAKESSHSAASRYRLATAFEICGLREEALRQLALALEAGFSAVEVARDPELAKIRLDPAYHLLLADTRPE